MNQLFKLRRHKNRFASMKELKCYGHRCTLTRLRNFIAQLTNTYILSQCSDESAVCTNKICRNSNGWDKQSTIIWSNRNLDK